MRPSEGLLRALATDMGPLGVLQVSFSDWPAEYVTGSGGPQGMLDRFCGQAERAFGTVETCGPTTLAGVPAVAIRFSDEEVPVEMRLLYVGTRQFQVATMGDVVGWTDDFFASFQLIEVEPSSGAASAWPPSFAP